jgi:hypothetical protein
MKKNITLVTQPDKAEGNKSVPVAHPLIAQKLYRHYTFCDHSHGRVNKHAFGASHGPAAF